MILYSEGGSKLEEADAAYVLNILDTAYPNHPWGVYCNGGGVMIKYLSPEVPPGWGMFKRFNEIKHDATRFKHEIIMAAGEWLERAGLVRGFGDESIIKRVDGIPERFQPHQPLENMVIVPGSAELRTQPRPQAIEAIRKEHG